MAGLFDDLLTAEPQSSEAAPVKAKPAGLFDDLVAAAPPASAPEPAPPAPAPPVDEIAAARAASSAPYIEGGLPEPLTPEQIRVADLPGVDAPAAGLPGDGAAAVGRGIVNGVPVVGPYALAGLNRAIAAVRTLQNGTTFPKELKRVERFGEDTAKANPGATIGGELAGGVVGTAPLIAAAPVAFGVGAGTLPARIGASALSGMALGGADSAVRSDGDGKQTFMGAGVGAVLGAAGPAVGAGVGRVVGALGSKGRTNALVQEALEGVPESDLRAAHALIEQARTLPGGGVNLSLDEALNAVTGGQATRASQLARVVGNSGGDGGRIMGEFYAARPASVDNVGRTALEAITPQNPSPTAAGFDIQDAARAGVAATPQGQAVIRATQAAGPRVSPDQAGRVIQPELRRVLNARQAAREQQAATDYGAARAAPENVGVESTITVERPGEPIVTPQEFSRPQFTDAAPRPLERFSAEAPDNTAGPVSLARFVARNGGIALDGDAAATDLHRFNIPGLGNVARPNGKSIDNFWREHLIEHGYLHPDADGGAARDITNDLLRKLQNEQRGFPSYPIGAEKRAGQKSVGWQSDEFKNAVSMAESRLDEDLTRVGIDPASLHPDVRERVLGALVRGEHAKPLDAVEAVVGGMKENPSPLVKSTTVQEEIPDVRFGQVNPQAALDAIDGQLRTAKGDVRSELAQVRRDLFGPDGQTDLTVEGLLHARERLDRSIRAAQDIGDATKVRDLTTARRALDGELKAVPEVATADANFAANSRPIEPFGGNTPLGRITQQDPLTGRMATPTEQVPASLQGASAAREFLENATPEARRAYEARQITRILDEGRGSGSAGGAALREAMRQNEDILALLPEARARLGTVARAREGLARVEASPLGKLADRPDVKAATEALFPANPAAGSHGEISSAVESLSRSNARAARDLVRIYLEGMFNEATQDLKGIARQYGGAGFASAVRGNGQQRRNLQAAVQALPNGEALWGALDRMLTVLEATGYRPQKGSDTAFNQAIQARLKQGAGPVGQAIAEVVSSAAAGAGVGGAKGGLGGAVLGAKRAGKDLLEDHRMRKDGAAVARILTDPKAIPMLISLSKQPVGSRGAEVLTTKLIAIGERGVASATEGPRSAASR